MNKYESIIIIAQDVDEENTKGIITRFTDLINTQGKVSNVNEMGLRKLAYNIGKNSEGNYIVFEFEAKPELIAELERNYRITDEIIKFITVRKDEE